MSCASRDGVLVVDKPPGLSSHGVVARIRRTLGTRDVGHTGTLDPMATGVLVIAVGEGTKLVHWLTQQDKAYVATIALGIETDTLDADGTSVREVPPSDEVRLALLEFETGSTVAPVLARAVASEKARTVQTPPAYSAIKTRGQRAYEQARRGQPPLLPPRPVAVRAIELVACGADPASMTITVDVRKGYYVRSLARDLAEALGTVGHLRALRRTRAGCFDLSDAVALDAPASELFARMHPLSRAASLALPLARLTDSGARDARFGRTVASQDIDAPTSGECAWVDPEGRLVAIGTTNEAKQGRVLRGFSAT